MPDMMEGLQIGEFAEKYVYERLKEKYPQTSRIKGYFKGYDIWVPELNQKIEVKSDKKSQDTGNYLIEVFHYGKPSALLVTKADYWIIFDGNIFYWIKPNILKDIILLNGIPQSEFVGDGDDVPKKAYLVPKELIEGKAEKRHGLNKLEEWM